MLKKAILCSLLLTLSCTEGQEITPKGFCYDFVLASCERDYRCLDTAEENFLEECKDRGESLLSCDTWGDASAYCPEGWNGWTPEAAYSCIDGVESSCSTDLEPLCNYSALCGGLSASN